MGSAPPMKKLAPPHTRVGFVASARPVALSHRGPDGASSRTALSVVRRAIPRSAPREGEQDEWARGVSRPGLVIRTRRAAMHIPHSRIRPGRISPNLSRGRRERAAPKPQLALALPSPPWDISAPNTWRRLGAEHHPNWRGFAWLAHGRCSGFKRADHSHAAVICAVCHTACDDGASDASWLASHRDVNYFWSRLAPKHRAPPLHACTPASSSLPMPVDRRGG